MPKKFIYVKKFFKVLLLFVAVFGLFFGFIYAKKKVTSPDFGKTFDHKAAFATAQLQQMEAAFTTCGEACGVTPIFLQAIVFPEIMRYNSLKDGVEAESLRTLYVQFGVEYANFSIGLFQMKPGFAEMVEQKAKLLLNDSIYKELQLSYTIQEEEAIRLERVNRLMDKEWQMVYLTSFVLICKEIYKFHPFKNTEAQLQWFATVYNAGFDKSTSYIQKKITADNFYLQQQMPGKKFNYSAIVSWYYHRQAAPDGIVTKQ